MNGNLHVDIAAVKQRLQVIFGILNQPTYDEVMRRFEVTADISKINPEGIDVTYFDVNNSEKRCGKFAVENVTFNPLVTEDGVLWRDVMIDLVEL
ncbi:MAG: hypothetical protein FWE03_04865 [Firmicutes bacterium]|nr:hypothetical protein [Bacillota bacterium]